ncbi:hypothetical protein [Nonomuraea sp. NPDC005650]|uniref:hypothetical protein n=1 Tax=Nonomuraea sp. NPDC005650 TaxID=3157045 RepID=UPI0033A9362E
MASIVVSGATGMLGRLVIDGLPAKVPAGHVTAADLAARGVRIAVADHNRRPVRWAVNGYVK